MYLKVTLLTVELSIRLQQHEPGGVSAKVQLYQDVKNPYIHASLYYISNPGLDMIGICSREGLMHEKNILSNKTCL